MGAMERWIARLLQGVSLVWIGIREGGALEVFKGQRGAGVADYEGTAGTGWHGLAGEGGFELEVGQGDVARIDKAS